MVYCLGAVSVFFYAGFLFLFPLTYFWISSNKIGFYGGTFDSLFFSSNTYLLAGYFIFDYEEKITVECSIL